ncbi:MAG: dTDP-4-dehydrorhamnose 3,5-epimerase [Gammaproteobacteria bacterium]|nr:dTDP-4-dehydrorhamnose 3,5-epimerase [Gammaproteobacteria bacterium]
MKVTDTALPGVKLIETDCYPDERGYFKETWNQLRYMEAGIRESFVQDNLSFSNANVLRGLHYQNPQGQGKLVSVMQGEIFDVAVDIRADSYYFKQWVGVNLSHTNHRQLYIPPGFAHGFCVLSETALVSYKCTSQYLKLAEYCIRWDDPQLAIDWPVTEPIVSEKDAAGYFLESLPADAVPKAD